MRDYAAEAVAMLGDTGLEQLRDDRKLQLALVRLVEVVGEAASKVPNDFRERYPTLPWREAVAMRNLLIHGYDVIEHEILWHTVTSNLPPLVEELNHILDEHDSSSH